VQRRMIERQFHRIDRVPRVLGPDTKLVSAGGRVQFGLKDVPSTGLGAETRLKDNTRRSREKDMRE